MSDHRHIFSGHGLDRADGRRTDPEWIAGLKADPAARFLVFHKGRPLVDLDTGGGRTEPRQMTRQEIERFAGARPNEALFLGIDAAGSPLFAVALPPDAEATIPDGVFEEVRVLGIQARTDPQALARIALARSLTEWHTHHRFCSTCGKETDLADGGAKRICPACGREHFPRVDPVVIMLIHRGEKCLLARQRQFTPNMYSALAGFVEPGETIEEAVRREIFEEAGVRVGRVRYHSSQPWPFPSNLMIGCHGEGLSDEIVIDPKEIEHARWFTRAEVADMLEQKHGDGLFTPFRFAIAHHLIRAYVDGAI